MAFWTECQGQSPFYAKFGTVPGRHCAHAYNGKHQARYYPSFLPEQQELSCWTVPGSRTGGTLQDYTNWTNPELMAPTSKFPFLLDNQSPQLRDLGEYQSQENREGGWTGGSQRPVRVRASGRGLLREGWQRRWEPSSPVQHRREVSRRSLSDSSYRELEAWAARYSHSLPRRRRMGTEMRGASMSMPESTAALERGNRSGLDVGVSALQQTRFSANIRELEHWDRGGRQQYMAYPPSQRPIPDITYVLDNKDKIGYQRRIFSQPPGYIGPPPYNGPHKSSPVNDHYDKCATSWERECSRQAYSSQQIKQDVSGNLQNERLGKEEFRKEAQSPQMLVNSEGHKHPMQATGNLWTSHPIHAQIMQMHPDSPPPLPQTTTKEVQQIKIHEDRSSNVIEGREFRLHKKTGGATIFCLVSRKGNMTDLTSSSRQTLGALPLPLCIQQTSFQIKKSEDDSRGQKDNNDIHQIQKLADEVDFSTQTHQVESTGPAELYSGKNLNAKWKEASVSTENKQAAAHRQELHGESTASIKTEKDIVSPKIDINSNHKDPESSKSPVSHCLPSLTVKYPLWREPGHTGKVKSEVFSSCCLKAESEGEEFGTPDKRRETPENECHPVDNEEIKKDIESDISSDLPVTHDTCVVVRTESIPSPKKEHVHYLCSPPEHHDKPVDVHSTTATEDAQSNAATNQDVAPEPNANASNQMTPMSISERPGNESEAGQENIHDAGNVMEAEVPPHTEKMSQILFPCLTSFSEKETLEERAERILGIPLLDSIIEHKPEDATLSRDIIEKSQDKEDETSQITNDEISDALEPILGDLTKQLVSEQQVERCQAVDAACAEENEITQDQLLKEAEKAVAGSGGQSCYVTKENASNCQQLETKSLDETEKTNETPFEPGNEDEQGQVEKNPYVDDFAFPQPPSQCLVPPTESSDSTTRPPSDLLVCEWFPSTFDVMPSSLSDISASDGEPAHHPEPVSLSSSGSIALNPDTPLLGISEGETTSASDVEFHSPSPQFPPPPCFLSEFAPPSPLSASNLQELSPTSQDPHIFGPTEDVMSFLDLCVRGQNEESEMVLMADNEINNPFESFSDDTTEILLSRQQTEYGQPTDAASVKETDDAQAQSEIDNNEDVTGLWKEISNISEEKAGDSQNDAEDKPLEETEITNETLVESYSQEEENQGDTSLPVDDDVALPQTPSQCLAFPNDSDFPPRSRSDSPNFTQCPSAFTSLSDISEPNGETAPNPELVSLSSSDDIAISPEPSLSGNPETTPAPNLESCSPSCPLPIPIPPESNQLFARSLSPSDDKSRSVSPGLPSSATPTDESQCPTTLWDAVNRIRKHTAPDSETEEDEVSNLWDPQEIEEDFVSLDVESISLDSKSIDSAFHSPEGLQALAMSSHTDTSRTTDKDLILVNHAHVELVGHLEEDTLSSTSTVSHGSGDTVITGPGGNVEEETSDSMAERATEHDGDAKD